MTTETNLVCRVLVPSGVLGSGCPQEAFERGLSMSPSAIAVDAGSTDSGPHYLGASVSKMTRKATKRDLRQLMIGRAQLGVPLLIGSCGTSGTDNGVDWMADICREIAAEEGQSFKLALIYCEQDVSDLVERLGRGEISPLPPRPELTASELEACDHVVALMGYEPLAAAVAAGADIVLAGRTTDTAVLAAVPLMRGMPAGACWHAAKIAECGGLCTTHSRQGGVMLTIDKDGFDVEPLQAANACTPYTVSAHMLYENADPYVLKEPGVLLDVSQARYVAIGDREVRVTGSVCTQTPYTMKLEGAGADGFRTMVFSGVADPKILANLDLWLERLRSRMEAGIQSVLGYAADGYHLELRPYGYDALNPTPGRAGRGTPQEIGLMALVTASTQAEATEIAKYCNPTLLHFPLEPTDPMPSFAFPFSPAEVELGALYQFRLNHVVHVADPLALTRTTFIDIGEGDQHGAA
ncbi:MAG: acyclic terpene utilization AtuA family protein [Pseudomonadota bacterium]